jgi:HEAT repeat protein
LLLPYKQRLLDEVAAVEQQEVRWHVAQMVPRLPLSGAERDRAVAILEDFLRDESKIVQVNAMQALADLTGDDEALRQRVTLILEQVTEAGSPAVKARGRKLLGKLGKEQNA